MALLAAVILCCIFSSVAFANGLAINSVKVNGWNTTANTATVQFDIGWSNSWWDGATNWDAAWVFIKFSTDAGVTWRHATLAVSGHTTATGTRADIVVPTEPGSGYKGAFIQWADGAYSVTGSFVANGTKLVWDYGADSVTDAQAKDSTNTKVKVFGIEMVIFPEVGFSAGDTANTYYEFKAGSSDNTPWSIASEGPITTDNGASGGYRYVSGGNAGEDASGSIFTIPGAFPKGYTSFYLMKYEINQGQYRDFLNTLTQAQQNSRTEADLSNEDDYNTYVMIAEDQATPLARQTIKASTNPANGLPYVFGCDLDDDNTLDEAEDGEWIAMNYMSWPDLCAYADWAGLRPMTELEFEKAARADVGYPAGEYAWGDTSLAQVTQPANMGTSFESSNYASNGVATYGNSGNVPGPMRNGFNYASSDNRTLAAAGVGGNLELSGNVREHCVTVGNATGRLFTGLNGDGRLNTTGNADVDYWPGNSGTNGFGGSVTGATGSGYRGGDWYNASFYLRTSNRSLAANTESTRTSTNGGRLARTATKAYVGGWNIA